MEAHSLRAILQERYIRAEVVGETLQMASGDLPLGQSLAPRIWVREGDAGRAREIIAEFLNQARQLPCGSADLAKLDDPTEVTFPCEECGEILAFSGRCRGHVETCPHCGNYVDVPDADAKLEDSTKVTILCPKCGEMLAFPGESRGYVETCPHCGNYVDVPDA